MEIEARAASTLVEVKLALVPATLLVATMSTGMLVSAVWTVWLPIASVPMRVPVKRETAKVSPRKKARKSAQERVILWKLYEYIFGKARSRYIFISICDISYIDQYVPFT